MTKDLTDLVKRLPGKTEEEALALIKQAGCIPRCTMRDGRGYAITMDFRFDRVDYTVENNIITKTSLG